MTGSIRYTHGHEHATLASHGARTAASSAGYLLPHLESGMSLLDVGCGPGTITLDLAEVVAPGRVTAIENVEPPLAAARDNAEKRGDHTTVFQPGDVLRMDFGDDTFDVVHAHQVLQHLTEPVEALREMDRVCRPDGWIAVRDADYAAMAWYPQIPELDVWRALYRSIAHSNGAEPDAGRRLRFWSTAAGLDSVRVSTSVWSYADAQACHWWGQSQAERVLGDAFTHQALEQGAMRRHVRDIADGWRRWGDSPEAWFVIPNVEVLARGSSSKRLPTG